MLFRIEDFQDQMEELADRVAEVPYWGDQFYGQLERANYVVRLSLIGMDNLGGLSTPYASLSLEEALSRVGVVRDETGTRFYLDYRNLQDALFPVGGSRRLAGGAQERVQLPQIEGLSSKLAGDYVSQMQGLIQTGLVSVQEQASLPTGDPLGPVLVRYAEPWVAKRELQQQEFEVCSRPPIAEPRRRIEP